MCGICGYALIQPDKPPSLRNMMSELVHRGPDGEGMLDRGHIALGMRRLAIIDVKAGDQPISNEDESVWVVQNGEIYNYRELQKDPMSQLVELHGYFDKPELESLLCPRTLS